MYDIAIIGGGAAGHFCGIWAPKNQKKVLFDKNNSTGKKVLLSGGERCNVTNIEISAEDDYFGENVKIMHSLLAKFSNYDMIDWLETRGIRTCVEDRGRVILESGKSRELLELLIRETESNNTEILTGHDIVRIEKKDDFFEIHEANGKSFSTRNLVIATGGKSFSQVGTDGWGYSIAKQFGIEMTDPYRGLCGLATREDLSELSGSTLDLTISIYDGKKFLYEEKGAFLFTHMGLSGPIVFNAVIKLGEHLRHIGVKESQQKAYLSEHITAKLTFNTESMTKKVHTFFGLEGNVLENKIVFSPKLGSYSITKDPSGDTEETLREAVLHIEDLRSWNEAKVTGGGVKLSELTNTFESRKVPHLYFIGEVLDITGKTGGFNLQQAWATGYVCGKSFL